MTRETRMEASLQSAETPCLILDADRMDYLLRDSLYSGVAYGRYDMDWLLPNLTACAQGSSA